MRFIYQEEVDNAREIMDSAKKYANRDRRKKMTDEEREFDKSSAGEYEVFLRTLIQEYHAEWEHRNEEEGIGMFIGRVFMLGVLCTEPKDSKYYKGMGFK